MTFPFVISDLLHSEGTHNGLSTVVKSILSVQLVKLFQEPLAR